MRREHRRGVAAPGLRRGRPAKQLRLASETAQVLGLVIDAEQCRLVAAGLDGRLDDARAGRFPTPSTYPDLLEEAAAGAERLMERRGVTTLGLAVSMPGLIDYRQQQGVLSPNVPITNGHSPGRDLEARLGIPCVMVQESHALCLAERACGEDKGGRAHEHGAKWWRIARKADAGRNRAAHPFRQCRTLPSH